MISHGFIANFFIFILKMHDATTLICTKQLSMRVRIILIDLMTVLSDGLCCCVLC